MHPVGRFYYSIYLHRLYSRSLTFKTVSVWPPCTKASGLLIHWTTDIAMVVSLEFCTHQLGSTFVVHLQSGDRDLQCAASEQYSDSPLGVVYVFSWLSRPS